MSGGYGLIVVLVLFGGGAAVLSFLGAGNSTFTQRGASGLPERIFFAVFGAPRDLSKEAQLSWTKTPGASRPPPRGFEGRGASRRW